MLLFRKIQKKVMGLSNFLPLVFSGKIGIILQG